jgi:hypothetical protein
MTLFMEGLINSPLTDLGCSLAPLELSVHAWGVLGEPLTHLCLQECESIASECDSSALHRVTQGVRVASQWCLLLLEVATS